MLPNMRKIKDVDDVLAAKEALVGCYPYNECNNTVRLPNFINRLIIFNKSVWGEGVKVPFVSSHVVLPTMFDSYLRAAFGDYMKLPPKTNVIPRMWLMNTYHGGWGQLCRINLFNEYYD